MTPDDALWWWEKSYHPLTDAHRQRFKRQVKESGLLRHEAWVVQHAIRQNQRIGDAVEAAKVAAKGEATPRSGSPEKPKRSNPKPGFKEVPKPAFKQMDWKPAPKRSKKKSGPRSRTSSAKKPMENTFPHRSASGFGMVRNWGNRKAQPATSSDEREICKACDRPAMNCIC